MRGHDTFREARYKREEILGIQYEWLFLAVPEMFVARSIEPTEAYRCEK